MLWIILAILIILVLFVISAYNKLVTLRQRTKNSFSQMDVQLQRRFDLIPNLVETVKGYAKHEENTFKEVIEARNKMNTAGNINEELEASNAVTGALNKLFALSEAYPELKSNENFLSLQKDLKETEDKLSYARQFYNDSVLMYNNTREKFPSNIVANIFGFKEINFFKASEKEKEVPNVKF